MKIGESRAMLALSIDCNTVVVEVEPVQPTLQQLQRLQEEIGKAPQVECPVEHYFAPGLYTRVCKVAAGTIGVGKMHRHQHPTFLMSGTARINTDRGVETITGPHVWISQEHAKRAVYAVTDCVFATVHLNPTDTVDLAEIEAAVIVPESQIPYETQALPEFSDNLQAAYA